jgi:hypothetical protein
VIQIEAYVDGIDGDMEALVDEFVEAVEARGGTMLSVWTLCDDDGEPLPERGVALTLPDAEDA